MAEGILFNVVQDILKNLGSKALNEIASAWGFKAQLEKLRNTINTIKDVLQDAEDRQLQSHAMRGWLERLKAAVYDADDLFDELAATASRKVVMGRRKLSEEVKIFFSRSNHVAVAFSISNKIKNIRKKLDEIVKDGSQFAFVLRPYEEQRVVSRQGRDTHSFVDAQEVIGRDEDKKTILDIFDQYRDQHVCVVPIVGIGGLGKTTLAQVVYNEVEKHFDLSLWVCVSDNFEIKEVIIKILKSATNTEPQDLELDQLQKQLRSQITGKKYLLVLDDVWNDNAEKWRELLVLLKVGGEGSKILVTTRLMEVAKIMGTIPDPYHLKGLSKENSLTLFAKTAFALGQEDKDPELLSIGEKIVANCANVPLAIRTLGSLLLGKEKRVWLNLKERGLGEIPENGNQVMAILEVSYHHLKSPLKNCFAYCALFPKDYIFNKETLISLWMAQGFVIPAHESQSIEDAGEEYFLTLLQRCFFQDVIRDKWGNVESCKMHDLMHDLSKKIAKLDCKVAKPGEMEIDTRIRHLSFGYRWSSCLKIPSTVLNLKLLRTFLLPVQLHDGSTVNYSMCHQLLSSYRSLRVLDLHGLGVTSVPSSIGNLVQLRYINLSRTSIEEIPNSITELQNLQTLELHACERLRRLPTHIKKLGSLRSLDVSKCWSLTQMPPGLGVLTSLHSLPVFMVNLKNSRAFKDKMSTAQFCDLKDLNSLKGSLEIKIKGELKDPAYEAKEANLSSKNALMELHIEVDLDELFTSIQHDEAILEGLQPHRNLKKLKISGYRGEKLPSWAVNDNLCTTLPNLVEIELWKFERCQQMPSFSQLPSLKCLRLKRLNSVDYLESSMPVFPSSEEDVLFFPSLEELQLEHMRKLKGWWREVEEVAGDDQTALMFGRAKLWHQLGASFPSLLKLHISYCPNLKSMPCCAKVGNLTLVNVNENLSVLNMAAGSETSVASSSTSSGSSSKLESLQISNVEALISLPQKSLSHLASLEICDHQLVSVSRLEELFKNLNSLSCLQFIGCSNLRSINGGLEHLTALEKLVLCSSKALDLSPSQDVEDSMPWGALTNLQHLHFVWLPKLVDLPNGLQQLTNLRTLHIWNGNLEALPEWIDCFSSLVDMKLQCCDKLTSLPEGFRKLTKLNELRIISCRGLTKRCRGPAGEDWLKIQHIPLVIVKEKELD